MSDLFTHPEGEDPMITDIRTTYLKNNEKNYIGIDIGANGGIVVLSSNGAVIEVFKMPETRRLLQEKLMPYKDLECFAVLEKIHCRPTNGSKSNFTLGEYKERMLYTLELFQIPYEQITPQSWMKKYFMKKEKTETATQWKNRLKEKALSLFPKEKVTLWSADAFLIAYRALRDY